MKTVPLFILLSIIVIYLQYDLLKPTLELGFTPDDWAFVFWYKSLGQNPLLQIADVWSQRGDYTTVPLYYTGIVQSFAGFNFQAIQIISIIFKTLATLMIFPLVLVIFKSKVLAFLTTVLFAMSYPSTGALETVVEPTEYLGMLTMNIFLISYYFLINRGQTNWKLLALTTVLFMLTIMISITRIYPLLALVPPIEIYLWIQNPKKDKLKFHLLRIFFLYLPFLLLVLYRPKSVLGIVGFPPSIFLKVIEGNWHLALTPFQGIGHIIPFSAYWGKIFGSVSIATFKDYLSFILNGPTIIFASIILFLSFFKSRKRLIFIILTLLINLVLGLLVFYIATHNLVIPLSLRLNFDAPRIYSTIVGIFILSLAFVYWLEWQTQSKKDILMMALWLGPFVAFLFITLTWMLADINLGFGGPQDHYLLIPTFGICLFLASFLVIIYNKLTRIKNILLKLTLFILMFSFLFTFYYFNKQMITSYFNAANSEGRAAKYQQMIQSRFRQKLKDLNFDYSKTALFYFDTSQLQGDGRFWTEGFLSSFPFWMRFQGNQLIDGCAEVFYGDRESLAKLVKVENGQKGFVYRSLCVEKGVSGYRQPFHKTDNFYAFRLKNKDFIDIKEEVLNELEFSH